VFHASSVATSTPTTASSVRVSIFEVSASAPETFFAARGVSPTGITLRPSPSAAASFALPTTAMVRVLALPRAASASSIAVTAGVTNRPSSTAGSFSHVAEVFAARCFDVRRDPRDPEQLVQQEPEVPVGHDEEVH